MTQLLSPGPEISAHIRLASCLLHTLPGATGSIEMCHGRQYLVAHHRHDAVLTPCELRARLLQGAVPGLPHLAGMVRSIELIGGAVDIGGGLYRRTHPAAAEERWFVTALSADEIIGIARDCPERIDHRDLSVRVSADVDLGVCAVCITPASSATSQLDEVARWLHGRCIVDELVEPISASQSI